MRKLVQALLATEYRSHSDLESMRSELESRHFNFNKLTHELEAVDSHYQLYLETLKLLIMCQWHNSGRSYRNMPYLKTGQKVDGAYSGQEDVLKLRLERSLDRFTVYLVDFLVQLPLCINDQSIAIQNIASLRLEANNTPLQSKPILTSSDLLKIEALKSRLVSFYGGSSSLEIVYCNAYLNEEKKRINIFLNDYYGKDFAGNAEDFFQVLIDKKSVKYRTQQLNCEGYVEANILRDGPNSCYITTRQGMRGMHVRIRGNSIEVSAASEVIFNAARLIKEKEEDREVSSHKVVALDLANDVKSTRELSPAKQLVDSVNKML